MVSNHKAVCWVVYSHLFHGQGQMIRVWLDPGHIIPWNEYITKILNIGKGYLYCLISVSGDNANLDPSLFQELQHVDHSWKNLPFLSCPDLMLGDKFMGLMIKKWAF